MINHPNRKAKETKKATARAAPRAAPAPRTRAKPVSDHDRDYSALLVGAQSSFAHAVAGQAKVFTTDASGLWDAYLASFSTARERQIHNCHCCRRFIETYGGLVTIDDAGQSKTIMWDAAFPGYAEAFGEMKTLVNSARVTGVFLTKSATWGNPQTGDWQHLSVTPPAALVHRDRVLDPNQAAAAVRENFKTVSTALSEYGPKVLDEALRLLDADVLTRAEKFVGPVRWLRQLHDRPKGSKARDAVLWRAVAIAPEGFCHIKSSVLGPLLDDIVAGVPFADIQRKHAAKLHPLQYQRPQAAPAEGNVRAAEALVEKLGVAESLARRFARFDELPLQHALWVPPAARPTKDRPGVFGHLKTKQGFAAAPPSVDLPVITMTWDKFVRTVLGNAKRIEVLISHRGPFYALTTAANADAPGILKWDHDDERNPFAWYTYHTQGGSESSQWNLSAGSFVQVNAVTEFPNMWGSRPQPHLHVGALLILESCADTRTGQGNALFPECLRSELHGARSTIEAYSKRAAIGGRAEASACGYGIGKENARCELRVFVAGAWTRYSIDRWD